MDITILNRDDQPVPEPIRERAERRLERLERITARISAATVTFDSEGDLRAAEVRLTVAGRPPMVARGTGRSPREAFDRAAAKLERQLQRWRKRRVARRNDPRSNAGELAAS